MSLVITSHETFFHKATSMIVLGEDTAMLTREDDESVDIKFVSTRFAWTVIKEMAADGVVWFGGVLR